MADKASRAAAERARAAQIQVWSTGEDAEIPDEEQDEVYFSGDAARSSIPLTPEVPLTQDEQKRAELESVRMTVANEMAELGELLIKVGGDGGAISGPLKPNQIVEACDRIRAAADEVQCDAVAIHENEVEPSAHVLVRPRSSSQKPLEIRIAVIGNVDSGKSTLVGCLSRAMLDDGRGAARAKVFKHNHEGATGRTSAISQHNLCIGSNGRILNDSLFKASTCADYVARASKIVSLVDLAGHERYFKTTAYGLTGHLPDYAALVVGANAGVIGMCKEHLGVALALKVPVFFIVTKIDLCPEHILKNSLHGLTTVLKRPGVRKRPLVVESVEDVLTCARAITSEAMAPIFLTSAVTGQGFDHLRMFINLVPQRQQWSERRKLPAVFIIDETFMVSGVGTVVAGTLKQGVLDLHTPLKLGPSIADGSFERVVVKSIQYKRLPVTEVVAGQTAALAIRKIRREHVRKGMVLVHEELKPRASWEFDAEIAVLTHATTIQPRYQAMIHCEIISQAARVVAMNKERLRSGDRATVRFRFLQHPEYITSGTRFVFREGRTKGLGMVISTEAREATMSSAEE